MRLTLQGRLLYNVKWIFMGTTHIGEIMLTSICGINWGDEGKGRMVDLLSSEYDVVCRYQGGNNAGHTVINE